MTKKLNFPCLRFKKDDGTDFPAWEQRELSELTDRKDNLRIPISQRNRIAGSTPYYGANGIQDYVEGFTHDGTNVLIAEDGANDFDHYPVCCVEGKIWVNNHAHVLKAKENVDPHFLAYGLGLTNIKTLLTGGTRAKLTANALMSIAMRVPSHSEQQKIGSAFDKLDKTIALHQKKLEHLKKLKKSLLQNMFPREGEIFPRFRFPEFTAAWEQRKLPDLLQTVIDFRGRTPKKLGLTWSEKGYLALSALNVKDGYIDRTVEQVYGNQELYERWMGGKELRKGFILFTTEAPMGNVTQVPDDKGYILSQRTIALDTKKELISNDFLAVSLKSSYVFSQLTAFSSGGTAKGVSQKSLSKVEIRYPNSLEEQDQISKVFKTLQDTIALHQRKLEKMQLLKKALLQQMFV